jgi:hypothetical protein
VEEISLVKDFWACHPERPVLEHFVFRLSGDVPVSWHLTQPEKDTIVAHMGADTANYRSTEIRQAMAENASEETRLARFFDASRPPIKDTVCAKAMKRSAR